MLISLKMGEIAKILFPMFLCLVQVTRAGKILRHSSYFCLAPKGSTTDPESGTYLVHTQKCRDLSAFFILHSNGVIEHETSGLCLFLTNGRIRNRQKAVLSTDCSNKFKMLDDGSIQHIGSTKCLRPTSSRMKVGVMLQIYSGCGSSINQYQYVDIIKGCDSKCLGNLLQARKQSQTFDEFYAHSEKEASTTTESSSFLSQIKTSSPELYKDLLSTSFPLDKRVLENMVELVKHFGIETVKQYRSLFVAAAYIHRRVGLTTRPLAPCGGTGRGIGGMPIDEVIDIEDLQIQSDNELKVVLDDENYKAQKVIDDEREKDEANGIDTTTYTISPIQKLMDKIDAKLYHKMWTNESLEVAKKLCQFSDVSQIKFPPRGYAMNAIEGLEYLLSRNTNLLPQNSLHFPWPLTMSLRVETSLRECNWIWRRLENGDRIIRYSRYTWDYRNNDVRCKESDWNICSIPRIIEDGGVCGRQSQLARITNQCLGIPSGFIKQPAHAALYYYEFKNSKYTFKVGQSVSNIMNTYTYWKLEDDSEAPYKKINAEYHKGLSEAMNHGYETYREGRVALLLYSRIYEEGQRNQARELLIEALEKNPHMMDIWMKLIHDITGEYNLPYEGQNILRRLPVQCPQGFSVTQRTRVSLLVKSHLSKYAQMYLEVLLRLLAPPSCCSQQNPEFLAILKDAEEKESREIVKDYLFDAFAMCALETSTIQEYVKMIEGRVLKMIAAKNDEELSAFSDIIGSVNNIIVKRSEGEVKQNSELIKKFYLNVCGALPRLHVTASAWIVLKQYQECVEYQLKFLQKFIPNDYASTASDLETLKDTSEKSSSFWVQFYNNGWLYGRSIDIIPLVTGIKKSVNGGGIVTVKVNLAQGKPTATSTTSRNGRESYRAVDGLLDQNIGGGSCLETKRQKTPWFRVDLGSNVKVSAFIISNVNGYRGNRLKSFEIRVGNSTDLMGDSCGGQHSIKAGETKAFFCNGSITGRYVTVSIPRRTILSFCEIQVYDTALIDPTQTA